MALLRNDREDQPRPLPIYASRACWEAGPNRVFPYLAERSDFRPIEAGVPITLDDVTITPLAVDHGPKAPGAMGFVVQHGDRRVFLSGDFLHVSDEDNPLLFESDVCFLDANTWHPAEWTWHQSVLGNLRLVEKWNPKRTYLVHYSGYEDREHSDDAIHAPMAFERLREELLKVAGDYDIQPAMHGMILGEDTTWPG